MCGGGGSLMQMKAWPETAAAMREHACSQRSRQQFLSVNQTNHNKANAEKTKLPLVLSHAATQPLHLELEKSQTLCPQSE